MGVRGVVAAGWAVDDVNASRFAERFYDGVLCGRSFGRAVLLARQEIYVEGAQDNTWGAYQCYGEPDWRLVDDATGAGDDEAPRLASLAEAVALAEEIREASQIGLDRDQTRLRKRLDGLNALRRRSSYLDKPDLTVALAEAYGELGSLQKAVRYYESAIADQAGVARLRTIEQHANLKVRLAVINCAASSSGRKSGNVCPRSTRRLVPSTPCCSLRDQR